MMSRLRFTRAYHTTAKRYVRHLNARLAVAREAALGIGSKPAGIRPTIWADALIECGAAGVRIGCVPFIAATLLPSVIH
jgi:hypothetical protein